MPDNSADYDLDDDLPDFDPEDRSALVWNLLLLVNPGDEAGALAQFDAWREAMEAQGLSLDTGDDGWLRALDEAIDWRAGFYVEAQDAATFVQAIDELAARWNLRIDWGGDVDDEEFLAVEDVPALMAIAYDRLREHGYTLWNWNTGEDILAGWIALSRDDEAMAALCTLLDVEIRPGSDAF